MSLVPDYPPNRLSAREIAEMIRDIYDGPDGGAGCCLHILTDDGNYGRANAEFCLNYALEAGHDECAAVALALVRATPTQQRKAVRLAHTSRLRPARRVTLGG